MYQQLLPLMQIPRPYQPNVHPFWDDEYISARMLEAHLNPQEDAASRVPAFMDRSADWIARIAPPAQYPRLLDLGCGPGLYAGRFARRGYQVTGVDLSRRSVRYATAHAQAEKLDIRYHLCDYCQLDLGQTFDLVTLIYCDYGVLSPQSRREVLRRARAHLRRGGRMLLDGFSAAHEAAFRPYQTWQHCPQGGFWRKEPYMVMEEGRLYPGHVIGQHIAVITQEGLTPYELWNTCFTPEALAAEALEAGLCLKEVYGDVAGAAYDTHSDTLAVVLEAK